MKKKVLLGILLLAVGAAAGTFGWQRWLADRSAAASGSIRLYGNIDVRDAQLAFFGQERIAEVLVDEGDRVEADQLLARLRTGRLSAELAGAESRIAAQEAVVQRLENGTRAQELAQADAAVAAAEVRVANAERVVERLRTTAASGASSAQGLDDAVAELDVARAALTVEQEGRALLQEGPRQEDIEQARATLAALRADLALLNRRLEDSELRSPARGVIRSRILEPGEMASPERPVLTLALTDPKWVRTYVPEPDLGRISLGMPAEVFSDSFPDRSFAGRVGFVSPVAEFTPKSVETEELRTRLVYEARIYVEDPEDVLRLGMPVTVRVETKTADGRSEGESGR